jgi:hypothetical protein
LRVKELSRRIGWSRRQLSEFLRGVGISLRQCPACCAFRAPCGSREAGALLSAIAAQCGYSTSRISSANSAPLGHDARDAAGDLARTSSRLRGWKSCCGHAGCRIFKTPEKDSQSRPSKEDTHATDRSPSL